MGIKSAKLQSLSNWVISLLGRVPEISNKDYGAWLNFSVTILMHIFQQEGLTGLLVEKGMFTKGEFLEMVKVVNLKKLNS